MKYMGSKKSMLKNGLGELLLEEAPKANRIFDPFCGSSSVVWFLAEKTNKQIIAGDLQKFSIDLANSILLRNEPLKSTDILILENWINLSKCFHDTVKIEMEFKKTIKFVNENRKLKSRSAFPITHAYAGYYFSIDQALKIDSLLFFLPEHEPIRSLAIAGLIEAASQCVASPGHTAQPFQPKGNGLVAIIEAWKRDPFFYVEKMLTDLSVRHANKIGLGKTGNAIDLMDSLEEGDLVFLDPPYSGVHYSRFYHVLETISRNSWENVSGRGRYPSSDRRPKSDYSLRGKSHLALSSILQKISLKKATAIVTFPATVCSNGLSGDSVKKIASQHFKVRYETVKGRFSTLGGNNNNRPARQSSSELILVLGQK
jgi:adenine-specific DNA-methyltransferase